VPRSLDEIYKHYEFNKTEPETLSGLIESVIRKSDDIKKNFDRFRELTETVNKILAREDFIQSAILSSNNDFYKNIYCLGIDGSFQCVGGLGGIWYVPISCSRVFFEKGLYSKPRVDVAADIHEVNEIENPNIEKEASFLMLVGETKALNEVSSKVSFPNKSIIFIDGPIVDPPWFSRDGIYKEYIKDRCDILKRCLQKNVLIIGCVKRIMGRYLINHIREHFTVNNDEKERVQQFISDAQLISYLFTKISIDSPTKTLFTNPIDVSHTDETHEAYLKEGLKIYTTFMQKDFSSKPIRLDLSLICDDEENVFENTFKAVKISALWTFPGHNVPLPVMLAHYKCHIRRGCAEVLYDEMITRTKSSNLFDNIVNEKMR